MTWSWLDRREWSLTRRVAVRCAATTVAVLALYGVWSTYVVLDLLRNDIRGFIQHEAKEFALILRRSDGTAEGAQRAVNTIVHSAEPGELAVRVRDPDGALLAEGGSLELFDSLPEPLPRGISWREFLFSREVAVDSRRLEPDGQQFEIVLDARERTEPIHKYLEAAAWLFACSALIAGLAGWYTARTGLRGLRDLTDRARAVDLGTHAAELDLSEAPREIREVATALDQMLMRIRTSLDDLTTFTAGLAHELRSPLQNLIGETEVALLSDRPAEEYRDVLRSNLDDLFDLSDAIDNLVAYCRKREPHPEAVRTQLDLAIEAEIALGRERRLAEREGVTLVQRAVGDTRIVADREGVLRLVRNLVANAVTAAPRGSTVELSIGGDAQKLAIVVEDRGPGVPPELAERLFEPFVTSRADGGRRGGYGLGLAICRDVVQEHEGTLRHEQREEGGTRFVATLPRGPVHPPLTVHRRSSRADQPETT